jgi:hypothetical protein
MTTVSKWSRWPSWSGDWRSWNPARWTGAGLGIGAVATAVLVVIGGASCPEQMEALEAKANGSEDPIREISNGGSVSRASILQ